jgi:hypothetical protein
MMSGIRWSITVIDQTSQSVLFAGKTTDRDEIIAVAAEARRLRPAVQILIRPPMGAQPYEYP